MQHSDIYAHFWPLPSSYDVHRGAQNGPLEPKITKHGMPMSRCGPKMSLMINKDKFIAPKASAEGACILSKIGYC